MLLLLLLTATGCASRLRTSPLEAYDSSPTPFLGSYYLGIFTGWRLDSPLAKEEGIFWEIRFGTDPNGNLPTYWNKRTGIYAYDVDGDFRLDYQIPAQYEGIPFLIKSHKGNKWYSPKGEIHPPLDDGCLKKLVLADLDDLAPRVGDPRYCVLISEGSELQNEIEIIFRKKIADLLSLCQMFTPEQIKSIKTADTSSSERFFHVLGNILSLIGIINSDAWQYDLFKALEALNEFLYLKGNLQQTWPDRSVYADSSSSREDVVSIFIKLRAMEKAQNIENGEEPGEVGQLWTIFSERRMPE